MSIAEYIYHKLGDAAKDWKPQQPVSNNQFQDLQSQVVKLQEQVKTMQEKTPVDKAIESRGK